MPKTISRLAAIILCAALLLPTAAEKTPPHLAQYTHGDRNIKQVAVTIDDWWEPELLAAFLDVAAENAAKLTLYPVGINLRKADQAVWQRALDEGHELGNHSNTHRKMGELSRDSILAQLRNMENNLEKTLGHAHVMNTVRFPFGDGRHNSLRSAFAKVVAEAGYVHVALWDVDTKGLKVSQIMRKVENGSIILLHGNKGDLRKLKTLLPELKNAGYELVTVSQLLHLTKDGLSAPQARMDTPVTSAKP